MPEHNEFKEAAYIETFTGKKFYAEYPEFDLNDIAHALSMVCRYGGHCSSFYSVAEHSVIVSALAEAGGRGALEGLLHDATEAYLGDVPAPFKQFLPDWREMDQGLEYALRDTFGLSREKDPWVKECDWVALFLEAYYLIPSRGLDWHGPQECKDKAMELIENGFRIECWNPRLAKQKFLARALELSLKEFSYGQEDEAEGDSPPEGEATAEAEEHLPPVQEGNS